MDICGKYNESIINIEIQYYLVWFSDPNPWVHVVLL